MNQLNINSIPIKDIQQTIDELLVYWGVELRYVKNHGFIILGMNSVPYFAQTQFNHHKSNIDCYLQHLNNYELIFRAYNIYFYLLETKRQRLKILNRPLENARITEKEWRNAAMKILKKDKAEIMQILNFLYTRKNFIHDQFNDHKCIKSDIEVKGQQLNLKDDYYIGFDTWLKTSSVKIVKVEALQCTFPNQE